MPEANIEVLTNTCTNILGSIKDIDKEYNGTLKALPDIEKQFRKVRNRAMEFENNTFIVLVVGPVKSGKSTLVNLIANEYVSPTHFLECTVRPSIISKLVEGEDTSITSYTTENQQNKVEYIDAIIDYIRGMETVDALSGLNIDSVPLNKENIKKKVELGLTEALNADTLVTVITTPGGQLLQNNVFIMDMPGFDGKYANLDDPVYETIAQRADLLIFVQSSNSAISKVSAEFLKILKENNGDVPVCLVHNFFEAAHWHSEEEKESNNTTQKEFAIREIRNLGFNIKEEHCFCINLGKVKDARATENNGRPKYADKMEILQPEAEKYSTMEQELYERVITHHDAIQLTNCINRTKQQKDKLERLIETEINERKQKITEYQRIEEIFNSLNVTDAFGIEFHFPDNILTTDIKNCIQRAIDTIVGGLPENIATNNNDAKAIVNNFINYCETQLTNCLNKIINIDKISDALFQRYLGRILSIEKAAVDNKLSFDITTKDKITLSEIQTISLSGYIDIRLIVQNRIPPIPKPFTNPIEYWFGHRLENFKKYFDSIKVNLLGSNNPTTTNSTIDDIVLPQVETLINNQINDIVEEYKSHIKEIKESVMRCALDSIIPEDKNEYVNLTDKLNCLLNKIKEIKIKV